MLLSKLTIAVSKDCKYLFAPFIFAASSNHKMSCRQTWTKKYQKLIILIHINTHT